MLLTQKFLFFNISDMVPKIAIINGFPHHLNNNYLCLTSFCNLTQRQMNILRTGLMPLTARKVIVLVSSIYKIYPASPSLPPPLQTKWWGHKNCLANECTVQHNSLNYSPDTVHVLHTTFHISTGNKFITKLHQLQHA